MSVPTVADGDRICRFLVDRGAGLICAHDGVGTLVFINPAAAEALGYPPEELIGTPLRKLLHPAVRQQFDAYLERIWVRGRDRGLMRLVARDGRPRVWAYDNVRYQPPGEGPIVLGHAHDVTEETWAERAVRERDVRYRTFIATSGEGICRVGFERDPLVEGLQNGADEQRMLDNLRQWGYIAECNDAFARMYGAGSAVEMAGVPLRNFSLLKDPRNIDGLQRLIRNRFEATEFECHEVDIAGNPRDFLVSVAGVVEDGSLRCLWALLRDVTEHRQAEAQAEKSRRRLLHLVERLLAAQEDDRPGISAEISAVIGGGAV
jgi:PAS domain S-box-containing protein